MRRLSTTAAVLITVVLALLLIAYVFIGGRGDKADARPRCSSPQAYDQIKGELFRRAAALRGNDQPAFAQVANYSVLRMTPPLRRRSRGADAVDCSGSLVLDLPPGLELAGGRHNITANFRYALKLGPGGSAQLRALSNVDPVVALLSTLKQTGSQTGRLLMPVTEAEQTAPATADMAAPPTSQVAQAAPRRPATSPAQPPSTSEPKAAGPRPRGSSPPSAPGKPAARPPVAATPTAGTRPSFNCRYARTRGEVAVCGDTGLASLDRQMAAQFYRAMLAASPAQRGLLKRTRSRFLAHRDSCGSQACMVDAYQGRMREIADIMAGRWTAP